MVYVRVTEYQFVDQLIAHVSSIELLFLFSVINAGRLYHLNPDTALEQTNQKFISRFNYIEQHSIKMGKPLKDMSIQEMDKLWEEAKKLENK